MKYYIVLALLGASQAHKLEFRPATYHQDPDEEETVQAGEDIQTNLDKVHHK